MILSKGPISKSDHEFASQKPCRHEVFDSSFSPSLTWRDAQHLIAETASVPNTKEHDWTINGAGYHVNRRYGFGLMDCGKMVAAVSGKWSEVKDWTNVGEQRVCEKQANTSQQ